MKQAIDVAVIEDDKLLILLKNESWILPGGKPEEGESDVSCLVRELRKELDGTKLNVNRLIYYDSFSGISPNAKRPIQVKVYIGDLDSPLGAPSAEIKD